MSASAASAATTASTATARAAVAPAIAAAPRGALRASLGISVHAARGVRTLPLTVVAGLPASVPGLTLDVSVAICVDVVGSLRHTVGLLSARVALLVARGDAILVASAVVHVVRG